MKKAVNIISASFDRDASVIIHVVEDPGKDPKRIEYTAIKGGISWPTDTSPPYFCIVGQLWDGEYRRVNKKEERKNLVFLNEGMSESLSLETFENKVTDSAKLYYCDSFFTDIGEEQQVYVDSFRRYVIDHQIKKPYPSLTEAPYLNNFRAGISMIKEFEKEKKITFPEDSIVYKQLKTIGREHLSDKPEVNFYAVNALRFVIGAFQKFNYGPSQTISRYWEWKARRVAVRRGA